MKSASYVVTLVANPEDATLSDALIARVAQVLPGFVGSRWLAPGVAADLFYDGEIDARAKQLGSTLRAPFMTLSFLALLVIPDLKLSDRGLFSGRRWGFQPLFDSPKK